MRDIGLVAKKVLVGVIVTAVPATLLLSGLWLTQHVLSGDQKPIDSKTTIQKRAK
jgi:hypothetical protein